jgi:hypothetical protein
VLTSLAGAVGPFATEPSRQPYSPKVEQRNPNGLRCLSS